jgi:hypothetical protein
MAPGKSVGQISETGIDFNSVLIVCCFGSATDCTSSSKAVSILAAEFETCRITCRKIVSAYEAFPVSLGVALQTRRLLKVRPLFSAMARHASSSALGIGQAPIQVVEAPVATSTGSLGAKFLPAHRVSRPRVSRDTIDFCR